MEVFQDPMREALEGFEVGELVELITVDATRIGGAQYHFTSSSIEAADGSFVNARFGGVTYTALPFESEGWDHSAGGTLPQPTVRFMIAREDGDSLSMAAVLLSLVNDLEDMLGARVLRLKTLRKFLDDGAEPNPQAHMGIDVYQVLRKTNQTPDLIEFQLSAALDVEDAVMPARQVTNHCSHVYRRPLPDGEFDYTAATCPYVGSAYFDINGQPEANSVDDRCGRGLRDCKARFGANAILPYRGFPGVGKFRA